MANAPEQIFKAYDVRGLYGQDIDADTAEQLGRAFIRVLADLSGKDAADLRVGLGRDMRLTAPDLSERYKRGMMSEGAHVVDAGQVGTEMLYFLVGSRGLDGGLHAYRHDGFWACMDTYKDAVRLNDLWASGDAPWARK